MAKASPVLDSFRFVMERQGTKLGFTFPIIDLGGTADPTKEKKRATALVEGAMRQGLPLILKNQKATRVLKTFDDLALDLATTKLLEKLGKDSGNQIIRRAFGNVANGINALIHPKGIPTDAAMNAAYALVETPATVALAVQLLKEQVSV